MSTSPKSKFLERASEEDFDNLIQVEPNEYNPSDLGVKAHLSLAKTKIVRGGLGSGKTRWATEDMNQMCLDYPGSLHFVGRKDLTSLKTTTQREYLEFVVRPQTIDTFHVNDNTLYYKNGSMVLFRETKDPAKVKSLELTSYILDEADENEDSMIYDFLDQRLRQKFVRDSGVIYPPHCGRLVFNPTHEDHWLYKLSKRTDIDLEDFQFSTYLNAHNLPPNYIHDLEKRLAPWDRRRLLHGEWGRSISGNPVFHGFSESTHVRALNFRGDLPLLRAWDFGFGHPAVLFAQLDPTSGRLYFLREFLGSEMRIGDVAEEVKRITRTFVGPGYPIQDYGDPHGADEKDTSVSSIEYLRLHHQIFVQSQRSKIQTGIEEMQQKILTEKDADWWADGWGEKPKDIGKESLLLVDSHCKIFIDALLGGYHRGIDGRPVKDGYFDHLVDTARYLIVNTMGRTLAHARGQRTRKRPRCRYTGY